MEIKVAKITDIDLLRKVNSYTTGKESRMSLFDCYKYKHSNCRSQLFVVEMCDIPLFCASQFVRSTQGVNWYQRSKRTDRGGDNFRLVCENIRLGICDTVNEVVEENDEVLCASDAETIRDYARQVDELPNRFDRYAPTDLLGIMNAEAIMNMSAKRLCAKASKETREIWEQVLIEVAKVDQDLVHFCTKPCTMSGVCREPKPCGFMASEQYRKQREMYKLLFRSKP